MINISFITSKEEKLINYLDKLISKYQINDDLCCLYGEECESFINKLLNKGLKKELIENLIILKTKKDDKVFTVSNLEFTDESILAVLTNDENNLGLLDHLSNNDYLMHKPTKEHIRNVLLSS